MSSSCPSLDDDHLNIGQSTVFGAPTSWIASKDQQALKSQNRFGIFAVWMTRHRTRKALRELDIRQLEDVGLNSQEILDDIQKPFWKA